jgi:hypothetical protein
MKRGCRNQHIHLVALTSSDDQLGIDPALELADRFLITHRGWPIPLVPLYAYRRTSMLRAI